MAIVVVYRGGSGQGLHPVHEADSTQWVDSDTLYCSPRTHTRTNSRGLGRTRPPGCAQVNPLLHVGLVEACETCLASTKLTTVFFPGLHLCLF